MDDDTFMELEEIAEALFEDKGDDSREDDDDSPEALIPEPA